MFYIKLQDPKNTKHIFSITNMTFQWPYNSKEKNPVPNEHIVVSNTLQYPQMFYINWILNTQNLLLQDVQVTMQQIVNSFFFTLLLSILLFSFSKIIWLLPIKLSLYIHLPLTQKTVFGNYVFFICNQILFSHVYKVPGLIFYHKWVRTQTPPGYIRVNSQKLFYDPNVTAIIRRLLSYNRPQHFPLIYLVVASECFPVRVFSDYHHLAASFAIYIKISAE